jgi:hypothetical protein
MKKLKMEKKDQRILKRGNVRVRTERIEETKCEIK